MLQWVLLFEPGIEHAVSVQNVGSAGLPQGTPGSETVILPDPVHDYNIISSPIGTQPGYDPGTEGIVEGRRTEYMNRKWTVLQKWCIGMIKGRHFNSMSRTGQNYPELIDGLNWAAARGIDGTDDVKDFQ